MWWMSSQLPVQAVQCARVCSNCVHCLSSRTCVSPFGSICLTSAYFWGKQSTYSDSDSGLVWLAGNNNNNSIWVSISIATDRQNTMRLWLPQLFASIREYEQLVESNQTESTSTSICVIIDYSVNRTKSQLAQALGNSDMECTVNVSPASYTNNLIVAAAGLFSYMLAGFLVNLVGFKRIMCKCDRNRRGKIMFIIFVYFFAGLGLLTAGSCAIGMYWSSSSATTVALASIFTTMGSISATSVLSASLNMFPTALR